MSFDFMSMSPVDCGQVELAEAEERDYWTDRLAVSESALQQAVQMMGSSLGGVSTYLEHIRKWPTGTSGD